VFLYIFNANQSLQRLTHRLPTQFLGEPELWRMVKKLCLGIEIAESEDEEFCIVDTM